MGTDGNIIGTQRYTGNDAAYYVYNKDVQGSTVNLVKDDGKADVSYRYEDFGETTSVGENTSGNETCYTGGRYDETTGLYYLNARYYNPEDGRFLSEDTYRGATNEPDTQHLYAYCADNPINYVDPSGHKYTRVWEQLWGKYWYDKSNHKKYGKYGNVRKAKRSTDSHLKKYRRAIDKENSYMEKLQKNLGKQAIKSILLFGVGKVMGVALKGYKKLPKFVKKMLPFGVKRFLSSHSTNYIRKSLQNIKNAQAQYKIVKNNFSKIKR